MIPYWLLFLYPVFATLLPFRANAQLRALGITLFAVIATLMIGLRYKVGGDWSTYLGYVDQARVIGFLKVIASHDPAYMFINWLAVQIGLGIAGVNLIGGAIFMYGLVHFCRNQPLPWLSLIVATPFLLIVVAMGYSRQAIALGIVFLAFSVWPQRSFIKYCALVFIAAAFHKSAVVMFFFGLSINNRYLLVKWMTIVPTLIFISWILVKSGGFESRFYDYFVAESFHAKGGLVRVLMNVIPSIVLLLHYKRFRRFDDYDLWKMIALLSLLSLPAVLSLSMVVDRFALYLAPIQIAVYSRFPVTIEDSYRRSLVVLSIILLYASVLFVWLNYGINSSNWIPYRLILWP